MKFRNLIFLSLLVILLIDCAENSNYIALKNGDQIDKGLVGTWTGIFKNSTSGIIKNWQITRNTDGTYYAQVTTTVRGRRNTLNKSGKWWTQNKKYFEKPNNEEQTEVYDYIVTGNNQVNYSSIKTTTENNKIEFTETKE